MTKMNNKKSQQIFVSWLDIENACKEIVTRLNKLNFTPDVVITPLKGGTIPAVIISHLMNVNNLVAISAKRTTDNSVEAKRQDVAVDKLPRTDEVKNKKILIIDEIADSGDTLQKVYSEILKLKPKQIITGVIVINSKRFNNKNKKPDIYIREVDKWVVFPWENN